MNKGQINTHTNRINAVDGSTCENHLSYSSLDILGILGRYSWLVVSIDDVVY